MSSIFYEKSPLILDKESIMNDHSEQNKYKNILGSRKAIVLLTDCLMAGSEVISNLSLVHRIPRRNLNGKLVSGKGRSVKKCTGNLAMNLSITDNDLKEKKPQNRRKLTQVKAKMNQPIKSNNHTYRTRRCATENGKAELDLEKHVEYNKNADIITAGNNTKVLYKDKLLEQLCDTYALNNTKDVDKSCSLIVEKSNPILEKQDFNDHISPAKNGNTGDRELKLTDVRGCAYKAELIVKVEDHNKYHDVRNENGCLQSNKYIGVSSNPKSDNRSLRDPYWKEDTCESTNFLRKKQTHIIQDVDNQTTKRVKLNRNSWIRYNQSNQKIKNPSETKNENVSSKTTSLSNTESNISPQNNLNVSTQAVDTQLESETVNSNFMQQNGNLSLRNTEDQSNMPPAKVIPEVNNEDEEDGDSDAISLYANSELMEECNVPSVPLSVEKSYNMTDNVFENYYKRNTFEFNEMYDCNDKNRAAPVSDKCEKNRSPKIDKGVSLSVENIALEKKHLCNTQVSEKVPKKVGCSSNKKIVRTIFKGYCYEAIKIGGECKWRMCRFSHDFVPLMIRLYRNDQQHFFSVLDVLAAKNYTKFINYFYEALLASIDKSFSIDCVLRILRKLYDLKIATDKVAFHTIGCLRKNEHSLQAISNRLASIANVRDFKFVNWILRVSKKYTTQGEYWNTFRNVLVKTENLDLEIVQTVLEECRITQRHAQDINVHVIQKLCSGTRSMISPDLLLPFKHLIEQGNETASVKETAPLQSINYVRSPEQSPSQPESEAVSNEDEYSTMARVKDTSWQKHEKKDGSDEQNKDSDFTLRPIDDLPNPHSPIGRNRFWKFYIDVYSLQEGLKRNDYAHCLSILNSVKQSEQSFFTRACYQILSNEIKSSPYRLSKIISQSVQVGGTVVFYRILVDVTTRILANLVQQSLWVLAYRLLKTTHVVLKAYVSSYMFDAATIMLLAEIYLANQEAVAAFRLLKRTKIIYKDSSKWKVKSYMEDESMRVEIMIILLNALCKTHTQCAFQLFQFLIADQHSNHYPIGLTSFANKIVKALLLQKDRGLLVNAGKTIIKENITLHTSTFRALITALVDLDMDLAKKLYHAATGLGIYPKVQFHPTTYLIIHTDWTREEMYLAILILMQQLSSSMGHAIDRIQAKHFSVYLIFENIASKNQFTCAKRTNSQNDEAIERSKTLMSNILQTKFDPPLSEQKKDVGKIYKLDSTSVLRHLRCVYCA